MTFPRRRPRARRVSLLVALAACLAPTRAPAQTAPGDHVQSKASVFDGNRSDPREVSSYLSVVSWNAPRLETHIGALGLGDRFTLAQGFRGPVELQLQADFVIHAQFDLNTRSFDFVNADFIPSLPLHVRYGAWSGRARLGHWSAHLGDEFLLRSGSDREETSVEFIELLVARDVGFARVLAGGERRLRIVPRSMPRNLLRLGVDVRDGPGVYLGWLGTGRLTAGTNLRWDASTRGAPAFSLRGGIAVTPRRTEAGYRTWAIQVEFFDGPSPFGQYFRESLRTLGVSFRLR